MTSCALQSNFIFKFSVNKNPIRLYMAIPAPHPISPQRVIFKFGRQRLILNKQANRPGNPVWVFPLFNLIPHILLKLTGLGKPHSSAQLPVSASIEAKLSTSSSLSLLSKTSAVNLLGTLNSTGNSPRRAI